MKRTSIGFIVVFLLSLSVLHASITVKYEPVQPSKMKFVKGNEVTTATLLPTGFTASDFVAHIGTLTFTTGGEPIIRPILVNSGTTGDLFFKGPLTVNWSDPTTYFKYWGVATNKRTPFSIWFESSEFILYDGTITTSPYVVDIYLRSGFPSSYYISGKIYKMVGGTLGTFNVKVKTDNPNEWKYVYVPVNGQTIPANGNPPSNPQPILLGGSTEIPEVVPYGDPIGADYTLFIDGNFPFSLEQAFENNNPVKIASAHLNVQNTEPHGTYGGFISFSNNRVDDGFNLRLDGIEDEGTIPFKLVFLGQEITKGDLYEWGGTDLAIPDSYQDIYITGIKPEKAEIALAGTYSENIWVEFVPFD